MNKDLLPYNNVEIMQYINTHLPNQVIHLKLHKLDKKKKNVSELWAWQGNVIHVIQKKSLKLLKIYNANIVLRHFTFISVDKYMYSC